MTSKQDTELEKIVTKLRLGANAEIDKDISEAIQALTAWKDKEVEKAKLRLINTEIRKLQKNEVWYRFDDCVWELKQTRKRITKSLQSQGGKMKQSKESKGE